MLFRSGSVANGMVLYVDPPYLGSARSGRNYLVEMSSATEHRALAAALQQAKATVLLSGYDSPLYADLYDGWSRVSFGATTNGSPTGERGRRTEVVWSNRHLGQPILGQYDWPGMAICAAIATGGLLVCALGMRRRDIGR